MPRRAATPMAGLAIALLMLPALGMGAPGGEIGTGRHACTLRPGADCRDVVEPWRAGFHGNLRRARFQRADLRGADFRGADLRRADFRGARLRYSDLRGANLKGARFDVAPRRGRATGSESPSCLPNCSGADLSYADLYGARLDSTNFAGANLSYAEMPYATVTNSNFSYADMSYSNVSYSSFCTSNMYGIITTGWTATGARIPSDTRLCPSG